MNFEMDCLPSERVNLPLLASEVAHDNNTNKKEGIPDVVEGMELHSSFTAQDALMSSPEKKKYHHKMTSYVKMKRKLKFLSQVRSFKYI